LLVLITGKRAITVGTPLSLDGLFHGKSSYSKMDDLGVPPFLERSMLGY
jgi:hypothetical protein